MLFIIILILSLLYKERNLHLISLFTYLREIIPVRTKQAAFLVPPLYLKHTSKHITVERSSPGVQTRPDLAAP